MNGAIYASRHLSSRNSVFSGVSTNLNVQNRTYSTNWVLMATGAEQADLYLFFGGLGNIGRDSRDQSCGRNCRPSATT